MYWFWPWIWTLGVMGALRDTGDVVATPLVDPDLDAAAALHSAAFEQPWSGDELGTLLRQKGAFGFAARRVGQPAEPPLGFVLGRLNAGEAEILTIAVDKSARGRGVGRLLMDTVLAHLHAERAEALFLEVDEDNASALALYRRLRFAETGRRPSYYRHSDGRQTSALVLKRVLARPADVA